MESACVRSHLAGGFALCRQLKRLIKDTVVGAHNNSALLLGPRGTGKSLVRPKQQMQNTLDTYT